MALSPPPLTPGQVVAHRGYQRHYPENSPLAIEQAIACGARFVEIDVQFSADGVPLLYHDDTLDRLSGQPGKLSQHHFRALQALNAGEPARFGDRFRDVRIAGLSELTRILREHPEVQAFVELKEEAVRDVGAETCMNSIRETLVSVMSHCVLIIFDLDALRVARSVGFRRLGPVIRDWSSREAITAELDAEIVFCNYKRLPAQGSLYMEQCAVALYEVDDLTLAHQLLARGASYIETFAVGEMLGARIEGKQP